MSNPKIERKRKVIHSEIPPAASPAANPEEPAASAHEDDTFQMDTDEPPGESTDEDDTLQNSSEDEMTLRSDAKAVRRMRRNRANETPEQHERRLESNRIRNRMRYLAAKKTKLGAATRNIQKKTLEGYEQAAEEEEILMSTYDEEDLTYMDESDGPSTSTYFHKPATRRPPPAPRRPPADEYERFGLMIAAEIRSIDDLAERDAVMSAIQSIITESAMRRQRLLEGPAKPEQMPMPIDDRTEDQIAVASIKTEPLDPLMLYDTSTLTEVSSENKSHPEVPLLNPKEEAVEASYAGPAEVMDLADIKVEPEELSSQIYLPSSPSCSEENELDADPLHDAARPPAGSDKAEAGMAGAAIKEEPPEWSETSTSTANASDDIRSKTTDEIKRPRKRKI